MQVNWPQLWTPRRKRYMYRIAGYLLLIVTIAFPVGIFTGASSICYPWSVCQAPQGNLVQADVRGGCQDRAPLPVLHNGNSLACSVQQRTMWLAKHQLLGRPQVCASVRPYKRACPPARAGGVTNATAAICKRAQFAANAFCRPTSRWRGPLTSVIPPLLLTLWQNLCMPQLIYRGAQVRTVYPCTAFA